VKLRDVIVANRDNWALKNWLKSGRFAMQRKSHRERHPISRRHSVMSLRSAKAD
jgi:hypothetical protein